MGQEQLLEQLRKTQKAIDELFAELGNKRAGDWGIINEGCLALTAAIRELEGK